MYQLRYPELNGRNQAFRWSIRRTEIYHRISLDDGTPSSFLLMLNPVPRSKAEKKISLNAENPNSWDKIDRNPLRLDLLVFSAYADNWRSALADLTDIFHQQVRAIITLCPPP